MIVDHLEVALIGLARSVVQPLLVDANATKLLSRAHGARGGHLPGRILVLVVAGGHGDRGETSVGWRKGLACRSWIVNTCQGK